MTTGASIIGFLLRQDIEPDPLVPPASVKAGRLPDGSINALLVRTISSIERIELVRGSTVRITDRVGVTVRAESYREQVAIMAWVKRRCAGFVGDIAGAARVAVLPAGTGPDVPGPGNSFEQTTDFRVSADVAA
ncbi:MAG: hypothetical protein EOP21_02370 [Hyphomicrobiales bacterium]|nr:MAG: hypothetical protein EOP21_02370 [Hyphomicrobiales bacterium]